MDEQPTMKFRFQPMAPSGQRVLGPLEQKIMDISWEKGGAVTVAHVHRFLRISSDIAYTTVMTTMSRMAKKGLLEQDRSENSYLYSPVFPTRNDFLKYVARTIVDAMKEEGLLEYVSMHPA